jgi:hypothetical protein
MLMSVSSTKLVVLTVLGLGGAILLLNVYTLRNSSSEPSETYAINLDLSRHQSYKVELKISEDHPTTSRTKEQPTGHLPSCSEQPLLIGNIIVDVNKLVDLYDVINDNPGHKMGGFYTPPHCKPRDKVAIIIPFRDREDHLHILLKYLTPILRRQLLQFKVYVIEQAGNCSFNRGMLRNIGAVEAAKESDWHCFCFHDVDMILENDRNLYTCPESPKHLSVATDKFNYQLFSKALFGGVVIFTQEQFWKVNGYSNLYWGWGAEDDDLYHR